MWLFFVGGFVSAVGHYEKPGVIVVRARSREHLKNFTAAEPSVGRERPPIRQIVTTPERDYMYRVEMPVAAFLATIEALGSRVVDHHNFKDSCADAGASRLWKGVLGRVWSLLYDFQGRELVPTTARVRRPSRA